MAGIAAARAVSGRPAGVRCGLATAADDAALRALLREGVLPGPVSVSLEREPDHALASTIEGDRHDVLIARKLATGEIVAMASRAERDMFVNGNVARVGYLGSFRVDRRFRRLRSLLDEGFAFCRSLEGEGGPGLLLASFVTDNVNARRLLIDRPCRTAPAFHVLTEVTTFLLATGGSGARGGEGLDLRSATANDVPGIVACLDRHARRYQCAPRWTEDDLRSSERTRDLRIDDFIVASRGGRVVGCAALWDQRAFKQAVVRGYTRGIAWLRPLVNTVGSLFSMPPLPAIGEVMPSAFLALVAVDDDDATIFERLVAAQRARAAARGVRLLVTAFAAGHPLHDFMARRWRHHRYTTCMHAACWPDSPGERMLRSFDGRPFHFEAAVL